MSTPVFEPDWQFLLQRINQINPVAYARSRNYIDGAVTYLSPYISRGVISTKKVWQLLREKGFQAVEMEKLVQELAWRDFFQQVWFSLGDGVLQDVKQPQPDAIAALIPKAILNGKTGITAIDEQIHQFYKTGYLHNHLRMYIASLTCNIAKTKWQLPAKWMYYHLLDGDVASNHLSWQWVAQSFSVKKYYCNQENINKYTGTHQRATFLDNAYDVLPNLPIPEVLLDRADVTLTTQLPVTNTLKLVPEQPLCIYNSYQLDPLWMEGAAANRVLLLEPGHFEKFPVATHVMEWILSLAKNIGGIQIFTGSFEALQQAYQTAGGEVTQIHYKQHPTTRHYRGTAHEPEWLFNPNGKTYFSFFSFWKAYERHFWAASRT